MVTFDAAYKQREGLTIPAPLHEGYSRFDKFAAQLGRAAEQATAASETHGAMPHIAYIIRKSGHKYDEQNYVEAQWKGACELASAAKPYGLSVIVYPEMNISGAAGRSRSPEMQELWAKIDSSLVVLLAAHEAGRIARDESRLFSEMLYLHCAASGTDILTSRFSSTDSRQKSKSNWQWFFTATAAQPRDKDKSTFLRWCREHGINRQQTTSTLQAARRVFIEQNGFGSGTAALGWYLVPAHANPYQGKPSNISRVLVYPPHAEYRRQVGKIAMSPHITSRRKLWRHLHEHGILCPPFAEGVRHYAWTRSSISRMSVGFGKDARALQPDEPFVPSEDMLMNLLLHPIALGDVLFGSGEKAAKQSQRKAREAVLEGLRYDTGITGERVFIGNFPHLRIVRGYSQSAAQLAKAADEFGDDIWLNEDLKIDEADYWALARKWSRIDSKSFRDSNYDISSKTQNPDCVLRDGRDATAQEQNPWKPVLYCLRHVLVGTRPDNFYRLYLRSGERRTAARPTVRRKSDAPRYTAWTCSHDIAANPLVRESCSSWGEDNVLTRILDAHLLSGLKLFVDDNRDRVSEVARWHRDRETRLKALTDAYSSTEANLESWRTRGDRIIENATATGNARRAQQEVDRIYAQYIEPLLGELGRIQDEIDAPDEQQPEDPSALQAELRDVLDSWGEVSIEAKARYIAEFVDWVGVVVGDGIVYEEALIIFKWKHQAQLEYLMGWRGPGKDTRPFEDWEKEHIQAHWLSPTMTWEGLKTGLQEGRKWGVIRNQAYALGLKKTEWNRKKGNSPFAEASAEAKSFGRADRAVLYVQLNDLPDLATEGRFVSVENQAEVLSFEGNASVILQAGLDKMRKGMRRLMEDFAVRERLAPLLTPSPSA
jgi:hypothetical protein